jgi:two-component system NarL family response regulator
MPGRAVVVEDFVLLSQVWSALLTSMDYSVSVYHDGDNISDMILELEPEIILMDVNLEGSKTGIELSEELLKENPNLKIIALTLQSGQDYVQRALAAGMRGYVTKNSKVEVIKEAIQEVLNGNIYLCEDVKAL